MNTCAITRTVDNIGHLYRVLILTGERAIYSDFNCAFWKMLFECYL